MIGSLEVIFMIFCFATFSLAVGLNLYGDYKKYKKEQEELNGRIRNTLDIVGGGINDDNKKNDEDAGD